MGFHFPGSKPGVGSDVIAETMGKLVRGAVIGVFSTLLSWFLGGDPEDYVDTEESDPSVNVDAIRDAVLDAIPGLSIITSVVTGISSGLSALWAPVADLVGLRWAQVDDHETAIAAVQTTLEEVAAASRVTPAYAADINDMPTCSRDDLNGWDGNGDCRATKYTPAKVSFSSTAPVYFTPIVVDRYGTVDKLRWRVGNDSSIFGIDAYYMALCVYNPVNGNIEKVWDSGDIKNGVANTSSLTEVAVSMGISQECTPGQILFVAHLQIAPGVAQTPRSYACKIQPGGAARPGQLLDAWCYRSGNLSSIPSSISLASLTRINDYIPWAAVSVVSEV